jgi:hypothetical protein
MLAFVATITTAHAQSSAYDDHFWHTYNDLSLDRVRHHQEERRKEIEAMMGRGSSSNEGLFQSIQAIFDWWAKLQAELPAARAAYWAAYPSGPDLAARERRFMNALDVKDVVTLLGQIYLGGGQWDPQRAKLVERLRLDNTLTLGVLSREFDTWKEEVRRTIPDRRTYSVFDLISLIPTALSDTEARAKYVLRRNQLEFAAAGHLPVLADTPRGYVQFAFLVYHPSYSFLYTAQEARRLAERIEESVGPEQLKRVTDEMRKLRLDLGGQVAGVEMTRLGLFVRTRGTAELPRGTSTVGSAELRDVLGVLLARRVPERAVFGVLMAPYLVGRLETVFGRSKLARASSLVFESQELEDGRLTSEAAAALGLGDAPIARGVALARLLDRDDPAGVERFMLEDAAPPVKRAEALIGRARLVAEAREQFRAGGWVPYVVSEAVVSTVPPTSMSWAEGTWLFRGERPAWTRLTDLRRLPGLQDLQEDEQIVMGTLRLRHKSRELGRVDLELMAPRVGLVTLTIAGPLETADDVPVQGPRNFRAEWDTPDLILFKNAEATSTGALDISQALAGRLVLLYSGTEGISEMTFERDEASWMARISNVAGSWRTDVARQRKPTDPNDPGWLSVQNERLSFDVTYDANESIITVHGRQGNRRPFSDAGRYYLVFSQTGQVDNSYWDELDNRRDFESAFGNGIDGFAVWNGRALHVLAGRWDPQIRLEPMNGGEARVFLRRIGAWLQVFRQ